MNENLELIVGDKPLSFRISPEKVQVFPKQSVERPTLSPREQMHAALHNPRDLNAPMFRAITPDDRVCIVIDEQLPHLTELLAEVLRHLQLGGINLANVVLLVPPNSTQQPWADDLPDELADVHVEVHEPGNKEKLAYLATTQSGRRVYLNRTLVEAGFHLVLTGRKFDATFGYSGAEIAMFPTLSDDETREALAKTTAKTSTAVRAEAAEVTYLCGLPFFVQVIEGDGDVIAEVIAGLPTSTAHGIAALEELRRVRVEEEAELVIVSISGSAERITFLDLARAAYTASKLVQERGRIVLLCDAAPVFDAATEVLRRSEDPEEAKQLLRRSQHIDQYAARAWATATQRASLFLMSGYPEDVVEELFADTIEKPAEVQRLIDAARSVIIVRDAHKAAFGTSE